MQHEGNPLQHMMTMEEWTARVKKQLAHKSKCKLCDAPISLPFHVTVVICRSCYGKDRYRVQPSPAIHPNSHPPDIQVWAD